VLRDGKKSPESATHRAVELHESGKIVSFLRS
jgi:hypothetical protein